MRAANRHHQTLLPLLAGGAGGLVRNGLVAEYRFDECRNLLKYSQQFDNAAWVKQRSSVTANTTTAPDGTTTADALIEDSTAGNTHQMQGGVTLDDNTVYTLSIHAKASTRSYIMLNLIDKNNTSRYAFFDLSSGIALGTSGTISQTITAMSDGWYRCCVTANSNSGATSPAYQIRLSATGLSSSYNGDGTSGIYIWGAQLEQGSVARTYVPTTDKQLLMDYSRPRRNLLLPNQANACEDGTTTGFAKYTAGDTISSSAEEVDEWQGSYCLKVVTANAATNEGVYSNTTFGLSPSKPHTASIYIRGASGGETVIVGAVERTDADGVVGTTYTLTVTLTTEWQRVTVSRTFGTTGRAAAIRILTASKQAATFYVDGLQLEEGSTATAWEAPPNIGICGSTTGADTNDPTYTGQGLSHGEDDYVTIGGIYNAAGTLQNGYGITIAFYTAEVTAATAKLCLVSLGANKGVYLGAVGAGLTDETITVQYSATSYTYATGTIAAGWHILDLVWNGAQYEIWLDGAQRTGTDVDTPALLSLSAVKMRYDGTTYGSGLTGAYSLKYNRAPTLAERNQNKAYLKSYLLRERGITI